MGIQKHTLEPATPAAIGLGSCFLLVLALFAGLGYFAFPIADDHSFAMELDRRGTFGLFSYMYANNSGRYMANLLYTVTGPAVANLAVYHCVALFQIAVLVVVMRALVAACHDGSRGSAWFMTLCLSAAFISGLPSPSQGLYWLCGSIVYVFSFNAFFGLAAVLAAIAFSPGAIKKYHVIFLGIFLLFAMGGNEVTAAVCEFFLFAAMVCAWRTNHPKKRLFMYVFFAGTVLLLASFLAPGNFGRMDVIGDKAGRPWQWRFLINALGGAFEGYKWLMYTPLLPAIALCCLRLNPRWTPGEFGLTTRQRVVIVLVAGGLLFFGEFLLVYVTSKRAPYARIVNAIYHGTFMFSLAATAFLLRDVLRLRDRLAVRFGMGRLLAIAGMLTLFLMGAQPTVRHAAMNLVNGEFAAVRSVWLERLAMLPPKEQAKDSVLTLPALRSRPFPLIFRDLEEDQAKHQWIKGIFASYHGLKGVRIENRGEDGGDAP